MNISIADKVQALRDICDVGIIDAKKAIYYCQEHPNTNEFGYLEAKGCATNMHCTFDKMVEYYSKNANKYNVGKKWLKFLEVGAINDN